MRKLPPSVSKILLGLGALVLYQALVNGPPLSVPALLQVQLETWIMLGAVGFTLLLSRRGAYILVAGATVWAVLLFLFAHTARLFEIYFGRPFDLKYDFFMAGNLIDLLFDSYSALIASLILGGAALALILLIAVFAVLTGAVGHLLARPRALVLWFFAGGALTLLTFLQAPPLPKDAESTASKVRSIELGHSIVQLFNYKSYQDSFARELAEEAIKRIQLPPDLAALDHRDVFVIFLESYGRAIWDAPAYREILEPRMRQFEDQLKAGGYSIATRFIASPAFGGGSWLAHSSFQAGVWTENNVHWEQLLQSAVRPLPSFFNAAGYTTVSVMPAMDIESEEWPEGAYFEFKADLWQKEMEYTHHGYAWSPMPDQFVLYRFDEKFLRSDSPPAYAEFVMTSSHVPFSAIPPFHEGDWEYEALMTTLRNDPMELFPENTYQALPRDVEGYTAAITYSLKTVVDYFLRHYTRDAVVIVLGDHQPISIMPGTETNQVPIHIFSKDADLIDRYTANGFNPGWFPREDQEIFFMQEFLPLFLRLSSETYSSSSQ